MHAAPPIAAELQQLGVGHALRALALLLQALPEAQHIQRLWHRESHASVLLQCFCTPGRPFIAGAAAG
jgi:hypothetical protein